MVRTRPEVGTVSEVRAVTDVLPGPWGGDRIEIHGIQASGKHGLLPHERFHAQPFVVDLICWLDLAPAGASDELSDSVDYSALAQLVRDRIVGEPVNLVERLAHEIAEECLQQPLITSVQVSVHKPHAPVGLLVDDIVVTVRRDRLTEKEAK
ncbi:dihydroneopterin aldolase [Parenemella sanctibonifatiensis]|uniref:7,8-dihydroneopterin aldolase n=1 Tax=Parenemella sanctibonifatiensis TaxID=2016505 RepID=A0A255ENP5_9ACTN|nr:dihydroneopterin aldolase [Parenemella sanctibonifatiensis]